MLSPKEAKARVEENKKLKGKLNHNNFDENFIANCDCPSCGNCMWGYENGKMVCAVCGYIMERNEEKRRMFQVIDDKLIRIEKVNDCSGMCSIKEVVITKDEFIACYDKWIRGDEDGNT